jgi:integrase
LALNTGMRRGEQYRLRWQDVDLKNGILTVARSKHGEARRIQINSVAHTALLQLRKQTKGVGYVSPGFQGPRSRDWRRWFDEVVESAEIPNFRWHDLRHTFASRLVMAGVPLRAVQTLLGHKRIETTLRFPISQKLIFATLSNVLRRNQVTPQLTPVHKRRKRNPRRNRHKPF